MPVLDVPGAGEQPRGSDVPVPDVVAGGVLVRTRAAGLNPVDGAVAAGVLTAMMPHEHPVVPGRDAAGMAVGEGVEDVTVRDEVFGHVPLSALTRGGMVVTTTMAPDAAALAAAGLNGVSVMAAPVRKVTGPLTARSPRGP